ncbi:hypothetical protein H6784_04250 [Candidatus Nomurabacteria bacterium]|nr:hypothetical protein [Candidatus Kaiserbacteria bacterium]MCB9814599.1 hypothetical protein [Candidatus Nomurabacteria bacterium]
MNNLYSRKKNHSSGYLLVLVLVMGSVFLIIISNFIGFVVTQNQLVNFRFEQQRATEIAEAGLNYYKWHLAHYPGDIQDGTGLPGPYVHQYTDPEDGVIGEFSLDIDSSTYCGDISSIDVKSTAFTYAEPDAVSSVGAKYTRPTVADYSFITNGSTWYGSDRVIYGPLHSNQGIRMDGENNSSVGSGQASWTCDSSFGCSPTKTVDGVYTTGSNATPGLFSFPVSPIDFAGLTLDLSDMKNRAQNNGGIYYGPTTGYGYRVIFNSNGTVSIYRVNNTYNYISYSTYEGDHWGERNVITSQTLLATRTIDSSCPLLFFEDKVWIEGDINQKVTIAAADLNSSAQTNIVIEGDVDYVSGTNAGLLAIAEDDIDIGLTVPDYMTVNGIYIAQNGRFGRNHYSTGHLSSSYDQYVKRELLTRTGTVVSNGRVGTKWTSSGNFISGFNNRVTSFDLNQVNSPPPLTPQTSDVYTFKDWRQGG